MQMQITVEFKEMGYNCGMMNGIVGMGYRGEHVKTEIGAKVLMLRALSGSWRPPMIISRSINVTKGYSKMSCVRRHETRQDSNFGHLLGRLRVILLEDFDSQNESEIVFHVNQGTDCLESVIVILFTCLDCV